MSPSTLTFGSLVILAALSSPRASPARGDDEQLIKALSSSKHSLAEGIQQVSKSAEVAISAKFEVEDGKLSLSVYSAEKGLGAEAEHNVLKEYAGDPADAAWKPEVEVFKDVEHVSRASEQLTLASLSPASLADILRKVEKDQPGTIYSITPVLRDRKASYVVLVADKGKSIEVVYDLLTGSPARTASAAAPKK